MMNYLAALLGIALMGAVTTASVYRADSISWKAKYDARVNQEQTAAQQAKDDAAKQEASDLAKLQSQSSQAIQSANQQAQQAKSQLQIYLQKGNAASKGKTDLSHECFSVPIAPDLIP